MMRVRTMLALAIAGAALTATLTSGTASAAPSPNLELIGTYSTGLANVALELTSGEVAGLKGDKLVVSNASDVSVDIVNVADPTAPALEKRIDLSAYGTSVTSVAVGNGLVAAAVSNGTNPGTLVLMSPGGSNLRPVTVGAEPDMVMFTPDGKRVLVANEGEPQGY